MNAKDLRCLTGRAQVVLRADVVTAAPVDPAPNTVFGVPGIADLTFNKQSSTASGQLAVTALELTLLSGNSGSQVRLGNVTCGPNAQTAIPLLSSAGLPVAGGTVLVGATSFWFVRRRRYSTPTDV